jgi:hypothetical protein
VIPKIDHIQIGKITRIDAERTIPSPTCRSSVGTLSRIAFLNLERAEWGRILKGTILGTLPNITGILFLIDKLLGALTTNFTGECEYESDGVEARGERILPVLATVSRNVIGDLRVDTPNENRLLRGGAFCPRSIEWVGTMRPLQTTRIILI